MTSDLLNALFEAGGAFFLLGNLKTLYKHKTVRGVYIPAIAFFALWGFWNMYYYPSLGQWLSFFAGLSICLINSAWVVLALICTRRGRS